ncbi:MAG: DUF2169 family type VI secretion system accessory protein [Planctomycetota bacterium]
MNRQVCAGDPDRNWILSVLAKRDYLITPDGRCAIAPEQVPLREAIELDPDNEDFLLHDTDLIPYKLATDVVVQGHAYAPRGQAEFEASVSIGRHTKSLLVIGDRTCALSNMGQILFSRPAPLGKVPLRYDRSYGGRDVVAEAAFDDPMPQYQEWLPESVTPENTSPFRYPRNPCGRGYLMEPLAEAVERLQLPNLEDPLDPLTPDRLVVGAPGRWPRMPLPQAFDWVHYGWFPRLTFLGVLPEFDPLDQPPAEVTRGFAPPDLMEIREPWEKFSPRCTNGASIGLQLPYLRGDEEFVLTNISPKLPKRVFRLPSERPRIWTDGRNGKLNSTDPVIHTVLIQPDEDRLSIVWRGSAPALRPYFPEELETMPFRVEW